MSDEAFSEEQAHYLDGFAAGSGLTQSLARSLPLRVLPTFAATLSKGEQATGGTPAEAGGPDRLQQAAQDRALVAGKALSAEEQAKRQMHGLDLWDRVLEHAREGRFPRGMDGFLFKFQGLFYVAPAEEAFMCRLRFAGGLLTAHQLEGVADLAERFGGGYADATTRANLQIRRIGPKHAADVVMGLADLGIITRGAGADNIRNITASPTAGIDPHELIDVRPLARQMHHYILNRRELYGLPRKFNIAFDGGGSISALQETNDIGFTAVRVEEGTDPAPGVYFRMQLGGITGHRDFARDVGILLAPEQCVAVAAAAVRVFIEHGDRTDRKKARLKYLLDQWGLEKYLAEIEAQLGRPLRRFPLDRCRIPGAAKKQGHIGFHAQRQAGLCYVGVVLPVGRMTAAQMRGLAAIARCYGCGDIRLTVWQNLLISDIPVEKMDQVKRRIEALGLGWSATGVRGGLVACTGNAGCKYAASNTKAHALQIADYLGPRVALDQPINIHLTGCPHSCAQHFIGDIGLLGTKVSIGGGEEDGDDLAEGYHIYIGGGYGERQEIGREIYRDVPATEAPRVLEGMLGGYLAHRGSPQETFQEFVQRHAIEALRDLFKLQKESTDHP